MTEAAAKRLRPLFVCVGEGEEVRRVNKKKLYEKFIESYKKLLLFPEHSAILLTKYAPKTEGVLRDA